MRLWRGVVEDNNDPLKIGRVRVRIFGMHTQKNENSGESFNFIKSSELPWTEVMGGTGFGLVGGIGLSSVLQQGTWVWVALDNDNPNETIIVGTITGTSKTRNKYVAGEGFNDKDGVNPFDVRSDESDINRLARGEKLIDSSYDSNRSIYGSPNTIHKQINDNIDVQSNITDVTTGADVSQIEPTSLNGSTVYPNAQVIETPGGHVFEFDDTSGNERIRLYHTSGSYIEIRPDGTFIQKSVNIDAESHYIHMSDVQEHIAKGIKTYIEDNIEEIIDGGIKRNVKLDNFQHIGGFFQLTADGNLEIVADLKVSGNIETTQKITATGDITSKGNVADSAGNLSSLRGSHDSHTHTNPEGGNVGAGPIDPATRTTDFTWASIPLGFK